MRRFIRVIQKRNVVVGAICIFAVFIVLNLLYALKALLGIDFFPGHHGGVFPLGEWIWLRYRQTETPLSFNGPYGYQPLRRANGVVEGYISKGWHDSSTYSPISVTYRRVSSGSSSSSSAQEVQVRSMGKGARWQLVQPVSVVMGYTYVLRATLKSHPSTVVLLGLREGERPWRTFFNSRKAVGSTWTTIKAQGVYKPGSNNITSVEFLLSSEQDATIDIVSASIKRTANPDKNPQDVGNERSTSVVK